MKNYIIYNESTEEITRYGVCNDCDFDLQATGSEKIIEGVGNPITCFVKNNEITQYTIEQSTFKQKPQPYYMAWSNDSFSWIDTRSESEKDNQQWAVIKFQRDDLLVASDYTQLLDVPLSDKDAWATYRQALRDITKQTDPFNIIWPTPPAS